jgi:hypothetical protein
MQASDHDHDLDIVWITVINRGYIDYTKNFLESLAVSGSSLHLIIYCIDPEIDDLLRAYDPPGRLRAYYTCLDASGFLTKPCVSNLTTWSLPDYMNIVFSKMDALAYTMARTGQPVGYIDTDIVVVSDPVPVVQAAMREHPEVLVFCQCDENLRAGATCSHRMQCPHLCSGLIVFRNDPQLSGCFTYTDVDMKTYDGDQTFLGASLRRRGIPYYTIDPQVWVNGSYFKYHTEAYPEGASTVHFNFLIGDGKRRTMMDKGLWRVFDRMTLAEWQRVLKPGVDLIVQASAMDGSDSWQPFPIGMSWQYGAAVLGVSGDLRALQWGAHDQTVLLALPNPRSDAGRRGGVAVNRATILTTLAANGISHTPLEASAYFEALPRYRFVISPEGNGVDCHRHYEALMAGCIPVMERNPLTEEKYRGCPVLWTTDYSEITEDYLNERYAEFLEQTYDFTGLLMSHYDEVTQEALRAQGNHWMRVTTGRDWYEGSGSGSGSA